jgi:uncharacterized protein YdhG (YjbR/CyaY superfamily)
MIRQRRAWTKRKPETIDDYLALVPREQRNALERLRRAIHAVAPGGEECISYSLPAFRLQGRLVAGFGATPTHCAYYPMSGTVVEKLKQELRTYDTSKGTIRFQPSKPLPVSLIRKLLRVRLQELA